MKKDTKKTEQSKTKETKTSQVTGSLYEGDFQLSDREKELIQSLFSWSKRSSETNWILGQPI